MSISRRLLLCLLAGLALAMGAACAQPAIAPQYQATTWRTANGLPHSSVSALFQDSDGYLWVGTYLGVARFDGVRFTPLSELTGDESATDLIESITQTSDGALWFAGTYRGLLRLDRTGHMTRFDAGNGLPAQSITLVRPHPEGGLWVGMGTGLHHVRFGVDKVESLQRELDQTVWSLARDRSGALYAATENGPWRRSGSDWQLASSDPQIARAHLWTIVFDAAGHGYAGFRGGLAELGANGFEMSSRTATLPSPIVRALLPDRDGLLWVATSGAGLVADHAADGTTLTRRQGLAADVIWDLLRDREGLLWVGTAGGLSRISRAQIQVLGESEGMPQAFAWAVVPRRAGGWWLGFNDGGLVAFDGRKRIDVASAQAMPAAAKAVLSVLDLGQMQWVGTVGGLFRRHADGRMQGLPEFTGRRIQSLYALDDDSLLVGTSAGLWRLRGEQAEAVNLPGVERPSVSRIRADGPGHWLIAVPNAGVYRYDGTQARLIVDLPNRKVRDALRTADGRLWLAAIGLHVLDQGVLRSIEPINRALPVQFHALETDASGRLWTSTNAGVLRVRLSELDRHLANPATEPDFMLFGEAEGMRSSEANGGTQNPLAIDADGTVWVATAEGVARIPGDAQPLHAALPRPQIERLIVDGDALAPTSALSIAAGARQISIDYTALRLADAERLRFRYRLKPSLEPWSDVGARRRIVFDALQPGRYQFEVAVGTATEPWSEPVALAFEVAPHWWQRSGLRALGVLGLLLLAAASVLWRTRELKARARALKVEVRARTQELEQANTALARAASHDFLTGLPNRRAFVECLDVAFAGNEPLALAMIDIDHFKTYNDSLGHVAGDRCLVEFASLLEAQEIPSQVHAARIGGEEFALIFRGEAASRATKILDVLVTVLRARAIVHPASPLHGQLSISAGLAQRGDADVDAQDLIRRADAALYRAKAEGRDRWLRAP